MVLGIAVAGCQTKTLDDPNDPRVAGVLAPDVIRRQLKGTSDMLMERVARGEIDDARFRELIAQRANELLKDLPVDRIDPARAWEYGEVLRTAKRWEQAKRVLAIAVAHAEKGRDEDRRVNDILRLAHAEAMLGEVPAALTTARRAFNAAPEASAPILPAVLLEIVPAARGKGHDVELAQILESAIGKHIETVVDPKSQGGLAFLGARPYHIRNAWRTVVELYAKSGEDEKARRAIERSEAMLGNLRRL